jgi:hypothetical protein
MPALSEPGGEGRVKALRYAQATRDQHRATVLPRWPIQHPLKVRTVSSPQFDGFAARGLRFHWSCPRCMKPSCLSTASMAARCACGAR